MTSAGDSRLLFARTVVKDLKREADFYREVLGYTETQLITGTIVGSPIEEILFLRPDGSVDLALLTFTQEAPPPAGAALNVFATGDIEAFERRVVSAGGSVHQPIGPLQTANGPIRMALYTDPEGIHLEAIEIAAS